MATGDLTSLANALAWLGLSADDSYGTVARLVSAVSTQVQQFLSRTIAVTPYTGTFNGKGGNRLMLPNYPIVSVSNVQVWACVIPARVLGSTPGYSFDDKCIYLDRGYCFERGVQNVKIVYSAGYASTPLDIEQACLLWIKATYAGLQNSGGVNVSMMKAGDHQLVFDAQMTKLSSSVIPMPPQIFAILQPYSRVFPA